MEPANKPSKLNKLGQKFTGLYQNKTTRMLIWIGIFATIGIVSGIVTYAARPAENINTEPTLVSPANQSELSSLPRFDWDGIKGAAGYQLQYSDISDSNFSSATTVDFNRRTTSYSPDSFKEGDYLWRVRAEARKNNVGPWSDVFSFSFNLAPAPAPEPEPNPIACGELSQEAEDGTLNGSFTTGSSGSPSNGQYVYSTNGQSGVSSDFASYCFSVSESSTYEIVARTRAQNNGSNSFFVSVNDGSEWIWHVPESTSFVTHKVNKDGSTDGSGGSVVRLPLSEGSHTIKFYAREANTQLDTVALVATGSDTEPQPEPTGSLLWSAGHESGNFNEWSATPSSQTYDKSVDCNFARTGNCSARLQIGDWGGIRLTYQAKDIAESPDDPKNLPDDAYYSAWYFIPSVPDVNWLNIFQWKQDYYTPEYRTHREMHWVVLNNSSSGDEFLMQLDSRMSADGVWGGSVRTIKHTDVAVPIGEWFQIKSRYVWSKTGNGRITTWLNGDKVWDVDGLYTEADWDYLRYPRSWAVNNYGKGINPSPFTIWVDDAEVRS